MDELLYLIEVYFSKMCKIQMNMEWLILIQAYLMRKNLKWYRPMSDLCRFVAIKVPDHEEENESQYYLLTSRAKRWRLSKYTVEDQNGAIYNTANQAYTVQDSVSLLVVLITHTCMYTCTY